MGSERFVIIENYGEQEAHAVSAVGEYATLCGLDGDDETCGQKMIGAAAKAKITCNDCAQIIQASWRYKRSDLHPLRLAKGVG